MKQNNNKKFENKKFFSSPRVYLLIISVFLLLLIILNPIYFFGLSGLNLINLSVAELTSFVFFELALILILVFFWEFYRRFFKLQ